MARTRGRTGHGQLLLLAALLFGIVTMHTLGHPSGHPPDRPSGHSSGRPSGHLRGGHDGGSAVASAPMGPAVSSVVSSTVSSPMSSPTRHDMGTAPAAAPHDVGPGALLPAEDRDAAVMEKSASAPEPHGGMSMDPLSVCLAVLGAFTLLLLVRAGLLRPGGTLAPLPAPWRLPHALRPNPPPPRILLARLSVLRI
ncbi:hypothetical protein ACFVYR_13060 [Streptomyces sp. NPDC058284]|uniref:hypothetical protein n=1 Tax=unclassified Streptomyces TaxID=2593676 RepID=UPI003662AC7A